jgi:hypothetical protein
LDAALASRRRIKPLTNSTHERKRAQSSEEVSSVGNDAGVDAVEEELLLLVVVSSGAAAGRSSSEEEFTSKDSGGDGNGDSDASCGNASDSNQG